MSPVGTCVWKEDVNGFYIKNNPKFPSFHVWSEELLQLLAIWFFCHLSTFSPTNTQNWLTQRHHAEWPCLSIILALCRRKGLFLNCQHGIVIHCLNKYILCWILNISKKELREILKDSEMLLSIHSHSYCTATCQAGCEQRLNCCWWTQSFFNIFMGWTFSMLKKWLKTSKKEAAPSFKTQCT